MSLLIVPDAFIWGDRSRARDDDTNGECKRDAFSLQHGDMLAWGAEDARELCTTNRLEAVREMPCVTSRTIRDACRWRRK